MDNNPDLEKRFTYHPPNEGQANWYQQIRDAAKGYAYILDRYTPDSREKSLALTKLEESVMWANAAIARGE